MRSFFLQVLFLALHMHISFNLAESAAWNFVYGDHPHCTDVETEA